MKNHSELRVDQFAYELPPTSIAQTPLEVRSDSRLLDTRDLSDHSYHQLPQLLNEGDLVVVNSTKVRASRINAVRSESGGRVEALLLGPLQDGSWDALVRPARRLRKGLELEANGGTLLLLSNPIEGRVRLEITPPQRQEVEAWIEAEGEMPLPPYISTKLQDPNRYQTMFADTVGSAAAPTAGLHFNSRLVADLKAKGINVASVELRVGIDTFRPIKVERLADHVMHSESYFIPEETSQQIETVRTAGGRVVAVGTTVARTLETAAIGRGLVAPGTGWSSLFITPGYQLKVVDLLLTNFHVPGSTLVVMIAAVMGEAWRDAYTAALSRGYRFLSFGDSMLLEPDFQARRTD